MEAISPATVRAATTQVCPPRLAAHEAFNPADFADLDDLATRILAFQDRYNATAAPFDPTETRTDLNNVLARTHGHDAEPLTRQAA